jgi:hypothetical protein
LPPHFRHEIDAGPSGGIQCGIAAFGVVRADLQQISPLRKNPGSYPLGNPAPSIKLADEQTVLGMAAVLRAIQDFGWQDRPFADWGVVGAPRFLGRVRGAAAMERFRRQGVRSMSPLIIPNLSLHAVSGAISMGLGCHGPNFGVGGSHGNVAEGLLAGLSLQATYDIPGVWVVATQWDPEPIPDTSGKSTIPTNGLSVALGLVSWAAEEKALELRLNMDALASDTEVAGVRELATFLAMVPSSPLPWRWQCPVTGGGALELMTCGVQESRLAG